MARQGVVEGDGVEDGDAAPVGLRIVVEASVVAEERRAPVEEPFGGAEVTSLASTAREREKRVHRIVAATVNDLAGRTQDGAVERGATGHVELEAKEAVAPVTEKGENFGFEVGSFESDGGVHGEGQALHAMRTAGWR